MCSKKVCELEDLMLTKPKKKISYRIKYDVRKGTSN